MSRSTTRWWAGTPAASTCSPLDDALTRLAAADARSAQVVEMRFFGGLALAEIADALDTSPATVKRDWQFAKGWLARELRADFRSAP